MSLASSRGIAIAGGSGEAVGKGAGVALPLGAGLGSVFFDAAEAPLALESEIARVRAVATAWRETIFKRFVFRGVRRERLRSRGSLW